VKLLFLLILLTIAGICIFRKRPGRRGNRSAAAPGVRLTVIVENQEPWLEGFVMKIFRCLKNSPHVAVTIFDSGSRDGTPQVLKLLQRRYPFELLSAEAGCGAETVPGSAVPGNEDEKNLCFDVRGLKGKRLLHAPLFCHLSQLNAGKIHFLSK